MTAIVPNLNAELCGSYEMCLELQLAIELRQLKTCGDVLRYVLARMAEIEDEAIAYRHQATMAELAGP